MESPLSRREAYWVLNGLPAIGPISLNRLLHRFGGDPCRVLEADRASLASVQGLQKRAVESLLDWRNRFDLQREMAQAASRGVDFVTREDGDYPALLKEIDDPPIGLYRQGNYDFKKPSVAIVGTRKTTLYGQSVARCFARDLAQIGFCVVSGMARGIDTFAHRGALEAEDGSTVCVLGNGIDIVYPPENIDLYKDVQRCGAVVSEFPFGRRADRQTFPMRNRLVSGMSHAVVVIESEEAGGSMITARFAADQGRLVCAVPGRIDQASSRGCHQLIRDGALLLESIDDLLEELNHLRQAPALELESESEDLFSQDDALDEDQKALLDVLAGGEAYDLETLSRMLDHPVASLSVGLMTLELKGRVVKRLDGRYELSVRLGRV
ncbi:DNA-processing protein DprA [Pelagicoccus sp. SDUM812003]|uniref:DNA-processing protein DprA n=1 Tax=Pelagicoccus sp. SDUM812003 TaxID=3041267 RepID=UPI00280F00C7|nr:DNA-processing protein DprA [Pelagicoccus sp. SDUM812003]MDQ8204817.1 DNA-processing protein DprA [Pelagicoccus sp. SDUM812003]